MGEKLRPISDFLEGFDISAAMLKKAEARGVYDRLTRANLQELSLPAASADLVTAADVFMYLGALDGIFARIAAGLAPGGTFAFSVERQNGADPFVLRETRRYAHGQSYVEDVLCKSGLSLVSLDEAVIRQDRNAPVEGLIVVAQRR